MRSTWLLSPAFAATALALPSQLTFSSPANGLGQLDLGSALKDAWNGIQRSQPIGWLEEGVREFSTRVQDSGISCTFALPHVRAPLESGRAICPAACAPVSRGSDTLVPLHRRVDPACRFPGALAADEAAQGPV